MKTDSKDKREIVFTTRKFVEWMSEETDFHSLRHPEITSLEARYLRQHPKCPSLSPHSLLSASNDDGKNNTNFEQLTLNLKC